MVVYLRSWDDSHNCCSGASTALWLGAQDYDLVVVNCLFFELLDQRRCDDKVVSLQALGHISHSCVVAYVNLRHTGIH